MDHAELKELKQLAMQAELARTLAHECNNFLNNLLLQLAISEKSFPESSRVDWANLRSEGKKLAYLFQQWQRYRRQSSEVKKRLDLSLLVQDSVEELRSESATVQLLLRPGDGPLYITGFAAEVQRLVSLLLSYAMMSLQNSGVDHPTLEIQLGKSRDRIFLRLLNGGATDARLLWVDFEGVPLSDRRTLSLPALTCESLTEHLGGDIRIERDVNGSMALVIELPQAIP